MDLLKIENIKAGYGKKIILKNINITIDEGELTGLLGLNGTGKTTLLKVINGLIKPISGRCIVNGKDCLSLKEKDRAKYISYMPQRSGIIYNIKVIDVVLMGITPYLGVFESPNKKHKELAYNALKQIGMDCYANENFLHLSEGQKQLIIIARNLMQNSKIMLFDEPDSALDFKNKHTVLSKIKEIIEKENKAGILTLHDPNFALSYCSKIVILHEGTVYSQFNTENVDKDFLYEKFSKIYGVIEVIKQKDKYLIYK